MAAVYISNPLKARLGRYFGAHGRFCARHPWEVIVSVVTLTVCCLSIGVLSGGKVGTICGINKPCHEKEETSDMVLLSMINSLAIIYVYNQFSSLRKAGSKYLLSIAGLFTIFASFVFGSGVVNLIDETASGLNEALPFFLLLIDLSKAQALANFAFRSKNKEEVLDNISRGMSVLGPNMTLDTLVEVLLIGIGTISGARQLELICWFGAMSLIANYVVFMTFYPAALSLVMEVCPYDPSSTTWQLDELARSMQEEEEEKKPNPVIQRVKIIMALGLTVVHLHGWFLSGVTGLTFGVVPKTEGDVAPGGNMAPVEEVEKVPLQEYLWWKAFNLSVDQIITLVLAAVLFVKYIFFDKSNTFASSLPSSPSPSLLTSSPSSCPSSPSSLRLSNLTAVSSCPIIHKGVSHAHNGVDHSHNGVSHAHNGVNHAHNGVSHTHITSGVQSSTDGFSHDAETMEWVKPETIHTRPLLEGKINPESKIVPQKSKPTENERVIDCVPRPSGRGYEGVSVATQTEEVEVESPSFTIGGNGGESSISTSSDEDTPPQEERGKPRTLEECLTRFKSESGASCLSDEELLLLVRAKHIPAYKLEVAVGDPERGVRIRRKFISGGLNSEPCLNELPYLGYNYSLVMGACCENVIGYTPIPVGVAGPLLLDGACFQVPMATTEGTLVASTNRGCRALSLGGGVRSFVLGDGMTRGPVVRFPSAAESSRLKLWMDDPFNFSTVAEAFNSTSRFGRLVSVLTTVAGRQAFIRFKATTGDAMGMNMLSKGVEKALQAVGMLFPSMEIISLSGNFCTDKKPAAINWIEGRGKSIVCEATISAQTVKQVLKTSVDALVDLNISKNLIGSAMAGSVGGFNAHAANIVTAIFIATGQDPAQTVSSSNCITLMERTGGSGEDLHMSCTMPCIEIGTVGGGTILPAQSACLKMLGVKGPHKDTPGCNAAQLARVVCGTVMAGELSLMSALAAGHLVKSHLKHNRSQLSMSSIPETSSPSPSSPPASTRTNVTRACT